MATIPSNWHPPGKPGRFAHVETLGGTDSIMSNRKDLWRNVIAKATHAAQKQLLIRGLTGIILSGESQVLSLASFFQSRPQKFFEPHAYNRFLHVLSDVSARHSTQLANYFTAHESELSRAFFFLHEINSLPWHDDIAVDGEFQEFRFIDQELHPTYLRLLEAVLFPFIHLIAFFSRTDRGKPTDGLDLFNAVAEASRSAMPEVETHYNNTMRNGIAHGGITFGLREVEYRDKKGALVLDIREVVRAFDDLLDFSNGLALALGAFLLTQPIIRYQIPQQILLNELRAETLSPWWSIDGCVAARTATGSQLIIYARPTTRDFNKAQFYSYLTAVLAEELAPGFDRYFLSLHSPAAPNGFAAFDGTRLRQVREAGPSSYQDYTGVLENNLLFFVPRLKLPRFLGRFDTLLHSFAIRWPIAVSEFRRRLGTSTVHVRRAASHRNGLWAILNATVVLETVSGEVSVAQVRTACHRILASASRAARRSHPWWSLVRWLPLGWARVAVFCKDRRKRRLDSYGLGPDLVCTVQFSRLKRVRAPNLLGSRIEQSGPYRIAWNRAWVDSAS